MRWKEKFDKIFFTQNSLEIRSFFYKKEEREEKHGELFCKREDSILF